MKIVIVALLLILFGLQFRLWVGQGSVAHIVGLNEEISAQESRNETLRERNEALYTEVDELKNGMDAIEERARSELGMVKEGETFYLIVEE